MAGVVIVCAAKGIYLGRSLWVYLWSDLDPAGRQTAATFESVALARSFISGFRTERNPDAYRYVPVDPDCGQYASLAALRSAGLGEYLGVMEADAKYFAQQKRSDKVRVLARAFAWFPFGWRASA